MSKSLAATPKSRSPTTWRTTYLTIYNTTFALLWSSLLISTLTHLIPHQTSSSSSTTTTIFNTLEPPTRYLQTLSGLDIIHSALHLIPSPLSSTFTQTATRIIQVWLIWHTFPHTTSSAPYAFPALILAWATADAIRYAYLTLRLHDAAPTWLVRVRYGMFVVLYPVGIGAEWWLMFRAMRDPTAESMLGGWMPGVLGFLLLLYVPGAYSMFTYMLKQRRKALARLKL